MSGSGLLRMMMILKCIDGYLSKTARHLISYNTFYKLVGDCLSQVARIPDFKANINVMRTSIIVPESWMLLYVFTGDAPVKNVA